MKLSTKGRYGLRAILDIALHEEEGPVTLNSISERQGISKRYLEQLLLVLKQSGIVKSVRGFQGGYVLGREPQNISVGDIIRALEGPIAPVDCVNENESHSCLRAEICVTQKIWGELRDSMIKVLDSYSLHDLINKHRNMHTENYR